VQVAEFDTDNFETRHQTVEDQKLLVKFYLEPRPDRQATRVAGRPIMKDVEFISIKIPGSRNTGVTRPASPKDKARFFQHYEAFKGRMEAPSEGTPLTEWPLITRSMCENLAYINIKTVEQLAGVADTHIGQFMGGNNMKQKAADWLEVAADEAPMLELKAQLAERDERITKMEGQLEQLLQAKELSEQGKTKPALAEVASIVAAPSVASEVETPVEEAVSETALVPRRRRKKKVTEDGEIQDDKPTG
jgi:hypothetical protein